MCRWHAVDVDLGGGSGVEGGASDPPPPWPGYGPEGIIVGMYHSQNVLVEMYR